MFRFDSCILEVLRICAKHGHIFEEKEKQELWLSIGQDLFAIRREIEKRIVEQGEEEDESDSDNEGLRDLEKLNAFLGTRIQVVMKQISKEVNFRKIIEFMEKTGQNVQLDDCKLVF